MPEALQLHAPLLLPPEEGEKKIDASLASAPLHSGAGYGALRTLFSPSLGGSKRGATQP
jgi:hypothetical protein